MTMTPTGLVILVDDDADVRVATGQSLDLAGIPFETFASARSALDRVNGEFNGIIISDIRMPDIDGLQFQKRVREIDPTIPFILITGHGDIPMAVAALRDGVDDFIPKPFASGHLVASSQRGLARRQLELDNRSLRRMVAQAALGESPLVGETPAMVRLRDAIDAIAKADMDVLIEGEAGVGKELVAAMLHRRGKRRGARFVTVNCATLPDAIARVQLFGDPDAHECYAQPGLIESANRGTLFLADIDRLDLTSQAALLHVLENGEVISKGGRSPVAVDLRVIAASRHDLRKLVVEGGFREDLYYTLNVMSLRIPPLRERRPDIPLLFAHFVDEAAGKLRRRAAPISDHTRRLLNGHDWPGNVRELRSLAFQSAVGINQTDDAKNEQELASLPERVDRFEAALIRSVLEDCGGSAAEAVRQLRIPRKTFYDKLKRHDISIAAYRAGPSQAD